MDEKRFCRFCGEHLSLGAKFCTNCGAIINKPPIQPKEPPSLLADMESLWRRFWATSATKQPYKLLAGIVVGILILMFIGAASSTSSTVNEGGAVHSTPIPSLTPTIKATPIPSATLRPTATPTPAPKPTKGVAQNSQISVNAQYQGVYYESNQFEQPNAGNKYVQFYVTVTNIDYPDEQIGNPYFFTILDSNNEAHGPAVPSFHDGGMQGIMHSQPGEKIAGIVIFEIKQNAQPVKLVYDDYENDLTISL